MHGQLLIDPNILGSVLTAAYGIQANTKAVY